MKKLHHYEPTVEWTGNKGSGTFDYRSYARSHKISADGKPEIQGSSDASFRGEKKKYNPEDLFVSSISSCHMLWYLHLCSENNIVVLSYVDKALGTMQITNDGGGAFNEVILRPEIEISPESSSALAHELHEKAHKLCFIANSCNFPITCQPTITQ